MASTMGVVVLIVGVGGGAPECNWGKWQDTCNRKTIENKIQIQIL